MTRKQMLAMYAIGIPCVIWGLYIAGMFSDSSENSAARASGMHPEAQEECMFDLATQTGEFLQANPKVDHYEWSNEKHEGLVFMKNGDTLEVIRGGCNHFLFQCSKDLYFPLGESPSNEVILDMANQMAQSIFPDSDVQLIDSLIGAKEYHYGEDQGSRYWYLKYEGYASLEVAYMYWKDTRHYTLSVGYMMN